jgi:alpha-1,3-rhamnosyltransferase
MESKVSIIIPTYNGEKYIKGTIESCLNQTYPNVETIVIDDCSNDNTVSILKEYGEKIRLYLNEENQGISKNVNKGVGLSEGKYFILLGHDDLLAKNHVEVMVNEFINDTLVAIHCNSMLIDSLGKKIKLSRDNITQIKKTNNCIFELSIDNFISSCGMIHKKKVFEKVKGWDETYKLYGEWLYYIKSLEHGSIGYSDKVHAFYRRHETNITNTFQNENTRKNLEIYFNNCRSKAIKQGKFNLIQLLNIKIYNTRKKYIIKLKNFIKKIVN